MTLQIIQTLLPELLSFATPHLAAILNDPRPHRAWLRVLIIVLLVLAGAALRVALLPERWSWLAYAHAVAQLLTGSTVVWVLLRNAWLGKLEEATGKGLGAILDIGKGGAVMDAEDRLRNLNGLKNQGLISEAEYSERRAQILGEV